MKHAFFLIGAVAILATGMSLAETVEGRVIGVADGDTITVLTINGSEKRPRKMRIVGIDAPEKAQQFGNVAKEAMSALTFGKDAVADCRSVDRYGRDLCLVRVGQVDIGLRMIEQGLAWHYKQYEREQPVVERASYSMAETTAKAARRGIWKDLDGGAPPMPPWDWRRAKKAE